MKVVVGMHRSGTSVVALLLLRAGADFGDPAGFYPPDEWNPDGYHEQVEVLRLNRRLLNGAWGKLGNLFVPSAPTLARRGRALAPDLAAAAAKFNPVFVKDPRFNITAPVWEAYGARFDRYIICLREPMEVARSLQRRNRLPIFWGFRLWRLYFERLLANSEGRPRWVVDYTQLTESATRSREVAGLLNFAGLGVSPEAMEKIASETVRLRAATTAEAPYPADLKAVLARCRQLHERQYPS